MTRTVAVLGIDAAWTATQPSGVALLESAAIGWRCVAVAPSYASFVALARGTPVHWTEKHGGSLPSARALLDAVRALTSAPVVAVAADIPLATEPITGRRVADDAVSREFGARYCSTHTASVDRPGPISTRVHDEFLAAGFSLATAKTPAGTVPALIEVYPHPALLTLCKAPIRLPYKVAKRRRYWPDATPADATENIIRELRRILDGLSATGIHDIRIPLPTEGGSQSPSKLKAIEDAIDAVVSAWVGTTYLEQTARPYGDETAAIWIPEEASEMHYVR